MDIKELEIEKAIIQGLIENIKTKLGNHPQKNEILDLMETFCFNTRNFFYELGKMQAYVDYNDTSENVHRNNVNGEYCRDMLKIEHGTKRVHECPSEIQAKKLHSRLYNYVHKNKMNLIVKQQGNKVTIERKK